LENIKKMKHEADNDKCSTSAEYLEFIDMLESQELSLNLTGLSARKCFKINYQLMS